MLETHCHRLLMNFDTPLYSNALEDPFQMDCFIYLDSNKERKDWSKMVLDQYPLTYQYLT